MELCLFVCKMVQQHVSWLKKEEEKPAVLQKNVNNFHVDNGFLMKCLLLWDC